MMPAERRLELVHHQRKNRTCCRGLLRIMWIFREITLSTLVISFSLLSPGFKWYFECFAPFTQHYSAIRDRLSRMQTTRENKPAVGKEVVKRLLLAEVTITLTHSLSPGSVFPSFYSSERQSRETTAMLGISLVPLIPPSWADWWWVAS